MNQFGTTGIADAGVYGHVVEAGPLKRERLTATPQGFRVRPGMSS